LIDNGEDNNNQVMVQDGRSGYWYTYVDHEGSTITPAAGETGGIFSFTQGGVNGSAYAARMNGIIGKASIVYAGMGANLTDPKGAFDGSKYGGISFWAKRGAGTTPKIRVKLPDGNTDPDGQVCSACYNDFGMDLKLTEEWTKYVLLFGRMKQERGWGAPHPGGVASDKLYAIQFQVNDKGQKYDVWIDDLGFTGCNAAGAAPAAAAAPAAK
jgi:endoglucanase